MFSPNNVQIQGYEKYKCINLNYAILCAIRMIALYDLTAFHLFFWKIKHGFGSCVYNTVDGF